LSKPSQKDDIDALGQEFCTWFKQLFFQPGSTGAEAWLPERLEYQFAVSSPSENGEKILFAEAYHHRPLDWYAFDVESNSPGLGETAPTKATDIQGQATKSFIPTQVVFEGSPNTRWWTFEDRRTNFGDIKPETTDIAKIMLLDFGLIYANDWFVVPYTLPAGVITQIKGMSVTNVFGERLWIEAAGSGVDDSWQRWSMFTMNTKGNMGEFADTSLLLLPTVPKIQEGRPREQVTFIRDELSNMVWGIEKVILLANGESKPGAEAGGEIQKLSKKQVDDLVKRLQESERALNGKVSLTEAEEKELNKIHVLLQNAAPLKFNAGLRYQVMNSVPEHWIPFIPVHVDNNNREIQLQRAAMPRIIEGDPNSPKKIRPRTSILREGLDQEFRTAYYIHEEEVPRAGIQVSQSFQRARSQDGRVWVWLGLQKQIGRGEGSSGLAFDQLLPAGQSKPPA
jgi:hypothetical protein